MLNCVMLIYSYLPVSVCFQFPTEIVNFSVGRTVCSTTHQKGVPDPLLGQVGERIMKITEVTSDQ